MFRTFPRGEFGYLLLAAVPRMLLFWSGTGILLQFRDINTLKYAIFNVLEKAPDSPKTQKSYSAVLSKQN